VRETTLKNFKRTAGGAVYRGTVGDGGIVFVTLAQLSPLLLFSAAVPLLVLLLLSSLRLLAPSTISEAVAQPLAGCCSAAMVALFLSSNLMLRTSRRWRVDDARERELSIGAAMLSSSCICYNNVERYNNQRFIHVFSQRTEGRYKIDVTKRHDVSRLNCCISYYDSERYSSER
jgi:hypothetical protein